MFLRQLLPLLCLVSAGLEVQATAIPLTQWLPAKPRFPQNLLLVQEDTRRIPEERIKRSETQARSLDKRFDDLQRSRELERRNENGQSTTEDRSQPDATSEAIRSGTRFSDGYPPVDLSHVFLGEIGPKNSGDAAKGFHHASGDELHSNAKVLQELTPRDTNGIYRARIEITDPATGTSYTKESTMFPDQMKRDEVVKALQNAYNNATAQSGTRFVGPSGYGFNVVGFTDGTGRDFHIRSGYPDQP